jgi:beta-glucosidase-like glycosyl hydrolase
MCANKALLVDTIRDKWQFDGYVTSDCGALQDIWQFHNWSAPNPVPSNASGGCPSGKCPSQAMAAVLRAGMDSGASNASSSVCVGSKSR